MRSILFKFLIVILCVVLCVNFFRVTLLADTSNTVSALYILESFSFFNVDMTPLYNSVGKLSKALLRVSENFLSNTLVPPTFQATGGFIDIFKALGSILSVLVNSINYIFGEFIVDFIDALLAIFPFIRDILLVIYDLIVATFKFLNRVLGLALFSG